MNGTLALLIPIMALSIPFFAMWIKHREKMLDWHTSNQADRSAGRDTARIEELEDRVRVLERIVTDGGYDTARQIEALRDQGRVDELIADRPKTRA